MKNKHTQGIVKTNSIFISDCKNQRKLLQQLNNDDKTSFPPTAELVDTIDDMDTTFTTVPNSELSIIKTEEKSQSNNLVQTHNINASKTTPLVFSGPET